MKRVFTIVFVTTLSIVSAFCQTKQELFEQNLPDSVKYVLPEFQKGRLTYTDGGYSGGTFNISTVDQGLRYIEDGKVLAVANVNEIDRVTIGGVLFIKYKEGYLGVVDSYEDVLLCVSKKMEFDNFSKKGAYGMESQTTNVSQVKSVSNNGMIVNLDTNAKYTIKEIPYFYRKNTAYVASRNTVLKMFSSKKAQIIKYLDENYINFSKYQDVATLLQYIKSL